MSATDDMIGVVPTIVVAGAVTKMADSMFPKDKKTRIVYRTRKAKSKAKKGTWAKKRTKAQLKKASSIRSNKINKIVQKYI